MAPPNSRVVSGRRQFFVVVALLSLSLSLRQAPSQVVFDAMLVHAARPSTQQHRTKVKVVHTRLPSVGFPS